MIRPVAGIYFPAPPSRLACARRARPRSRARGQVLSVDLARQEVTIKHEDIPQFMPGMTMAFKVATPGSPRRPPAWRSPRRWSSVTRSRICGRWNASGPRPFPKPEMASRVPATCSRRTRGWPHSSTSAESPAVDRLARAGSGRHVHIHSLSTTQLLSSHGSPFPDRSGSFRTDAALAGSVRLLSVTLDPRTTRRRFFTSTRRLHADPAIWSFVTGQADELEKFGSQFGVSYSAGGTEQEIVHNLRTAVIDRADGC